MAFSLIRELMVVSLVPTQVKSRRDPLPSNITWVMRWGYVLDQVGEWVGNRNVDSETDTRIIYWVGIWRVKLEIILWIDEENKSSWIAQLAEAVIELCGRNSNADLLRKWRHHETWISTLRVHVTNRSRVLDPWVKLHFPQEWLEVNKLYGRLCLNVSYNTGNKN